MVALCEEEGSRFQAHYWGTRGMLGLIHDKDLHAVRDDDGLSIAEAMQAAGLSPERYREALRQDLDVFLELHIAHDRILYDDQIDIGIVESLTGLHRQLV